LNNRASIAGFTLVELIVVAAILAILVLGALAYFSGALSGTKVPPVVAARTEYYAEWEAAPPALLTSSGATITFKVQSHTDTLKNGFVTYAGPWQDLSGASVTFTLAGAAAARLSAGTAHNVLSVTVTTNADGVAEATLAPEGVGTGEVSVRVTTPSGLTGEGTPKRFEVQ
jgi:prepilin-type N-terminal cleavage/methylation domain-containing protein